MHKAIGFALL